MDDRIHFIEHKGKRILLCDFSHATAQQMQLLLEHVRITVAQHARESLLLRRFYGRRDRPNGRD